MTVLKILWSVALIALSIALYIIAQMIGAASFLLRRFR